VESSAGRLLELLSLLQSRPRWNATELSTRLGITPRTVRRDIARLRDLGYPVEGGAGRSGGYELGAGGRLPPLLLSDDEAVAVAVGLRAAASGGVTGYDDAAVAALAKLEQVLPSRLRDRVLALNASTVLVRSGPETVVDSEVLLTLAQACRRSERVSFAYRDASGKKSTRRVEPYGLVNAERRWYLVAFDLDRDDWRNFRVDRMTAPELKGHRFVRTEEPDTAAMVLQGLTVAGWKWQGEIFLRTSLKTAQAEVPVTIGSLQSTRGGTLLRIGADDLDWLARYVSSLPFEFEVRSPKELEDAIRAHARKLVAMARQ
jgi:predicted DNA-binding transcriptional regulator YafY